MTESKPSAYSVLTISTTVDRAGVVARMPGHCRQECGQVSVVSRARMFNVNR